MPYRLSWYIIYYSTTRNKINYSKTNISRTKWSRLIFGLKIHRKKSIKNHRIMGFESNYIFIIYSSVPFTTYVRSHIKKLKIEITKKKIKIKPFGGPDV